MALSCFNGLGNHRFLQQDLPWRTLPIRYNWWSSFWNAYRQGIAVLRQQKGIASNYLAALNSHCFGQYFPD